MCFALNIGIAALHTPSIHSCKLDAFGGAYPTTVARSRPSLGPTTVARSTTTLAWISDAHLPRLRGAAASRRSDRTGPLRRPRRPRWHAEWHDDVRLRPGLAGHRLQREHLRSGVRARPLRRWLLSMPSGLDGHVVPGPCPSVLSRLLGPWLVRRRRLPLRSRVDWQRLLAVALPGRLPRALRGRRRVRVRRRPHRRLLLGLALRRRLRRPRHLRGARTLRLRRRMARRALRDIVVPRPRLHRGPLDAVLGARRLCSRHLRVRRRRSWARLLLRRRGRTPRGRIARGVRRAAAPTDAEVVDLSRKFTIGIPS